MSDRVRTGKKQNRQSTPQQKEKPIQEQDVSLSQPQNVTPTKTPLHGHSSSLPEKPLNVTPTKTALRGHSSSSTVSPKRLLESSPLTSPSSKYRKFGSPSSSNTVDLHGYIISLTTTSASTTGNEFIDIRFKISDTQTVLIKIMKKHNQAITLDVLRRWKSSGRPLSFNNLSAGAGSSGVYFYNSFRNSFIDHSENVDFSFDPNCDGEYTIANIKKQSSGFFDLKGCLKYIQEYNELDVDDHESIKREAVFYDKTDMISITLWGTENCELPEGKWLSFSSLVLKHFFGLHLSTTRTTTVKPLDDVDLVVPKLNDDYLEYKNQLEQRSKVSTTTLSKPSITTVLIERNDLCRSCPQVITIIPGKKVVRCISCGKAQKPADVRKELNVILEIDDKSYTILTKALVAAFGEKIFVQCQTDEGRSLLEESLLVDDFVITHDDKLVIKTIEKV